MVDFKKTNNEDLIILETERRKMISSLIIENPSDNPVINELRFNYGYVNLFPFLINIKTGDKLELEVVGNLNIIYINFIGVIDKKQGRGTEMMNILTALCDKYDYQLKLEVYPKFGVPKRALIKFYKGFGFKKERKNIYIRFSNFIQSTEAI